MDYLQFRVKRLHLKMVAFGREIFGPKELPGGKVDPGVPHMTAARFDLLTLVYRESPSQSALRKKLDLCRATVSKMLQRLEDLGFVTRKRDCVDRRQVNVKLTKTGRQRLFEAFELVLTKGMVYRKIQRRFVRDGRRARLAAKPSVGPWMPRHKRGLGDYIRYCVYEHYEKVHALAHEFGDRAGIVHKSPFPDHDD